MRGLRGRGRIGTDGKPLESAIQAHIVHFLTLKGWTVWQMQLGSQGNGAVYCTPGIPDLYAFNGKHAIWLEVKRPKTGKLSQSQQQRHEELHSAGLSVHVVRSVEDVMEVLAALD